MRSPLIRITSLLMLFCLAAPALASPASAQQASGTPEVVTPEVQFAFYPVGDYDTSYFQVEVDAGESVTLTAGIANTGSEPIELRTFATNAYNAPNGGFTAQTEEDEPTGPTLWLDFPAKTLHLEPGQAIEQDFIVSVPKGTPPGQYVAALVTRTTEELTVEGSDVFSQILRNAMSVEVTVPGPFTPEFELGNPEFVVGPAVTTLEIPVINTGNILVKPEGELSIATPDGEVILSGPVQMGSVYGGLSTIIQVSLPDQFSYGDYLISVELTSEATGAAASIEDISVTLAEPEAEEPEVFTVDKVSVTPNSDPVQYADVSATITNNGQAIPTANVTLNVQRDGEEVESYPLAENQALSTGSTDFSQRYIPVDGWQSGTWTFQLVISAVSGDTETILATIDIDDTITVP